MDLPGTCHRTQFLKRIAARERREHASRPLDDREQSSNVPVAQIRIDHDVGATRSHGKISEAVTHRAVKLDRINELLHAGIALLFGTRPVACRQQGGLGKIRAFAHRSRTAETVPAIVKPQNGAFPASDDPDIGRGMRDRRKHRPEPGSVIALQSNQRAEQE